MRNRSRVIAAVLALASIGGADSWTRGVRQYHEQSEQWTALAHRSDQVDAGRADVHVSAAAWGAVHVGAHLV